MLVGGLWDKSHDEMMYVAVQIETKKYYFTQVSTFPPKTKTTKFRAIDGIYNLKKMILSFEFSTFYRGKNMKMMFQSRIIEKMLMRVCYIFMTIRKYGRN